MARRSGESQADNWMEQEAGEDPLDLDDDLDDAEDGLEQDMPIRGLRPAAGRRPMARRLIEQARENRELSRWLADFDDYVV